MYADEPCNAGLPAEVRVVDAGPGERGLDLDGDRQADIFLRGDAYYFRASSFPSLTTSQPWIRVETASENQFEETLPIDLVFASELGLVAGPIRRPGNAILDRAREASQSGEESPARIVAGATGPGAGENATIRWTTEEDGSIGAATIAYDDAGASSGVVEESAEPSDGQLEIPKAPKRVEGAGDLPAIDLLRTTPAWTGCRGDTAAPDEERLACAEQVVGDATVDAWVGERGSAAPLIPAECPET